MSDQQHQQPSLSEAIAQGKELTPQTTQPVLPTGDPAPLNQHQGSGVVIDTPKVVGDVGPQIMVKDDEHILRIAVPENGDLLQAKVFTQDPSAFAAPQTQVGDVMGGGIRNSLEEYDAEMRAAFEAVNQARQQGQISAEEAAVLQQQAHQAQQESPSVEIQHENKDKDPNDKLTEENFDDKYNEAIVVIDKTGMGSPINFSAEEQDKLKRAKAITLKEVETIELKTVKSKKPKKGSLSTILKRQVNHLESNNVLPASKYTVTMRGLSTYELMNMSVKTGNNLIDAERKWTLFHNKLVGSSLGDMSFDDFLNATVATDADVFIYGLLTATYPEDSVLPLVCTNEECGKQFDHHYSIKSLIRAEEMSADLQQRVMEIVNASHTLESARELHETSLARVVKTIRLPQSGYIVHLYVQTAHELLYTSIKGLEDLKDDQKGQAAQLSTLVKTILIPDPDDEGEYFEYDTPSEITDIIYSLMQKDLMVLVNQSSVIAEDAIFNFGLMDVTCPHCKKHDPVVPFDIEDILFYQYRLEMNSTVE